MAKNRKRYLISKGYHAPIYWCPTDGEKIFVGYGFIHILKGRKRGGRRNG